MMVAQFTELKGLRTIEETIAIDNDLYHAVAIKHITRTNLAHANEKRPCEVFQKFYFHLLGHYKFPTSRGSRKEKSPKLIDTTTISLNMNDFSWAKFRSSKDGIKINTRFDHNLACTDYLFITNANRHENSTFEQIRLTENDIAIFDRGYFNKRQFQELTESSISFVTRNKSNIEY